jgi:hypothetical protein
MRSFAGCFQNAGLPIRDRLKRPFERCSGMKMILTNRERFAMSVLVKVLLCVCFMGAGAMLHDLAAVYSPIPEEARRGSDLSAGVALLVLLGLMVSIQVLLWKNKATVNEIDPFISAPKIS